MLLGLFTRPVAFVAVGADGGRLLHAARAARASGRSCNGGELAVLFCFLWLFFCVAGPGPISVDALRGRAMTRSEETAEIAKTQEIFLCVLCGLRGFFFVRDHHASRAGEHRPDEGAARRSVDARLRVAARRAQRAGRRQRRLRLAHAGRRGRGNTYLRPFDDDRIIVNMSVWESVEQLRAYTYNGAARRDPAASGATGSRSSSAWRWRCGGFLSGTFRPSTKRSSGWRRSTSTARRRSPSRSRAHFRQHQLSSDLCRCHLREPGCASIGKWADFRHGELLATSVSIG